MSLIRPNGTWCECAHTAAPRSVLSSGHAPVERDAGGVGLAEVPSARGGRKSDAWHAPVERDAGGVGFAEVPSARGDRPGRALPGADHGAHHRPRQDGGGVRCRPVRGVPPTIRWLRSYGSSCARSTKGARNTPEIHP
eukprot:4579632-Pyramimonas_sp.AAC.2